MVGGDVLDLPYPSCAAEEEQYEGDDDKDAPAGHVGLCFGGCACGREATGRVAPWGGGVGAGGGGAVAVARVGRECDM